MSLAKLGEIPREVILGLVVIAMAIPILHPLGLPIPIGKSTRDFYAAVEAVPSGGVILFDIGYGAGGYPSLGPGTVAVLRHCFARARDAGVKIVLMATQLEGSMIYPLLMEEVKPEEEYGVKYGEDYVFLGYIAGVETAMAAVLGDLHAAVTKDYYGTPIENIPMLKDIRNYEDIDLVIYFTTAGGIAEGWVYQAYSKYNRKVCGAWLSMMTPSLKPYYDAGALAGFMDGIKGGAEYEKLINRPGKAIMSSDILSLTQTLVIIYIILGNIAYLSTRKAE